MELSIQGLEYPQLAAVLESTIWDSAFAGMELSIQGLEYPQLAAVLESMIQVFLNSVMGGYRQAVVAIENDMNLLTLLGFNNDDSVAIFMYIYNCF